MLGYAASMSQLQDEYINITGSNFKIREAIRGLHNVGILKMLKYKNASRGFLWVKSEWVKEGRLLDNHKPVGGSVYDQAHAAATPQTPQFFADFDATGNYSPTGPVKGGVTVYFAQEGLRKPLELLKYQR